MVTTNEFLSPLQTYQLIRQSFYVLRMILTPAHPDDKHVQPTLEE
jgi:hypothetical protein